MTAPLLTGQHIAEAEGAVHGLLETVLSGAEVTADEYVLLRVVTLRPGMTPAQAGDFLGAQRQLRRTRGELVAMLRGLADRGLVTGLDGAGPVAPTDRGAALYARLFAAVQEVTPRIYRDLDPADLGRTKETLALVAERAHALRRELAAVRVQR
jgi:hypothetical protein